MHKKILILIILLIYFVNLQAQNKRDYIWLFGSGYNPDLDQVEGIKMDFNNGGKVDSMLLYEIVSRNIVQICNREGKLLFYADGCRVIDTTEQIMEGGDSINYGYSWEIFCNGRFENYLGSQNSIILPDPANDPDSNNDGYYYIHKRQRINWELVHSYCPEMYYSYIDMSANGGRGRVTVKNKVIFRTYSLLPTYLTACKHSNKKD